jgi:hypothetical protein
MCVDADRGFASASEGVRISKNAMYILSFMKQPFCRLSVIGRAECWPGFNFPSARTPKRVALEYN